MAKLKKGIFGPLSGKMGPIVAATWNGIPYLRLAPKENAIPLLRSAAQHANEQKMKFLNNFLVPFHAYINIGFANLAIKKTALNAAYSYHYHNAITGVYPDFGIDHAKVAVSTGNLPALKNPVLSLTTPNTIQMNWDHNINPAASFDDQLMLVLYCPELHLTDGFIGKARRTDKRFTFQFLPELAGKALEVYLGLISLNRKKIADSIYMGRIEG